MTSLAGARSTDAADWSAVVVKETASVEHGGVCEDPLAGCGRVASISWSIDVIASPRAGRLFNVLTTEPSSELVVSESVGDAASSQSVDSWRTTASADLAGTCASSDDVSDDVTVGGLAAAATTGMLVGTGSFLAGGGGGGWGG